jgi:hypothetical protein
MKKIRPTKPYNSHNIPFHAISARMLVESPNGSNKPMIETKVVSLNRPINVETIPGIDIFNA